MEKILGNFLTQTNKDFPLDCETLDYMQGLTVLAGIVGNIGGDRVVLWGCEANSEGTWRDAGYVFLHTRNVPEGEILPWEGGSTTSGMYVRQEDVSVSVNNRDYSKAYTRRSLSPGIGVENYSWDDFTDIKTIKGLMSENEVLREELAGLRGLPAGVVQMWAGKEVPEGYVLCNGQELRKSEYGELYKVIGDSFSRGVNAQGGVYTTQEGCFRVPDLRGRFVVGQHDSDGDYADKGQSGGKKAVVLTEEELPRHAHKVKDYVQLTPDGEVYEGTYKTGGVDCKWGYDELGDRFRGSSTKGGIKLAEWIEHSSGDSGGGGGHENRPPYYVLAYIIKVK